MAANTKRGSATLCGVLMAFGMTAANATSASALAHLDPDAAAGCAVEVGKDRQGRVKVAISSQTLRNAVAWVVADFDRGKDARKEVSLNDNGEASLKFTRPRSAARVTVTALVWNGMGFTECSDTANVD